MSFLEMRGLRKSFGATLALDDVDLNIERGEVHALVGENGSGKSTLMRVLAGVHKADSGQMVLDGQPFQPRDPMDARRKGVAMIHQELSLCGHLSVGENILLGFEPHSGPMLDRSQIRARSQNALTQLGYPDLDPATQVSDLPIAVRQVVEIARAVAVGCQVVVFDEPTSSLTEADVQKLFEVVANLRKSNHAIIYISHFLDEVKEIADRLTVLRDGKTVGTHAVGDVSMDQVVSMMVGRSIDELYPRSERHPGEVLLDLAGVCGPDKPTDATMEVRRGEVVGIAGLNGSGRTELLRSVFGLAPVVSGTIRIGVHQGKGSPSKRWSQGVGLLSEDRKIEGLALGMSIADNMTLSSLDRFGPIGIVIPSRQMSAAVKWAASMDVRCRDTEQSVGELSGGNQQKVALARLLAHEVDLFLLDEPTRGIDVGSKQQIYQLIDQVAHEGKAVVMISSYLPELLGVCDRIGVMHKGRLGPCRPVDEIDPEAIMREATGA